MALRRDRDVPSPNARPFSQATQFRLLLVLAVAAAAFAIGREATRPIWSRWSAGDPPSPPLTAAQIEAMQAPVSENELASDWSIPPERLRRLLLRSDDLEGLDAEIDRRWRSVIRRLSPDQEFELLQVLLAATGERPAAANDTSGEVALSPQTMAKLRSDWEAEHVALLELLARPGESGEDGARLAASVRERVTRQLDFLASFDPAEDDGAAPEGEGAPSSSEILAPALRAWDGAALASVTDATANGDPGDFALWYRLFQRLSHVDDDALRKAGGDRVTEAALASQPESHRGQLFALVGTARGGKSVKALPNALGIERYYVIWVQPDDDRDALIAVYSLSKPEGFPELPEQAELDRFAIRVEAPAYFLKKFAYESQNGISVSPLALARSFRFEPPPPEIASAPPSPTALGIGTGVAAAIGVAVVVFIYRRTRRDLDDLDPTPERIDETSLRKRFIEPS